MQTQSNELPVYDDDAAVAFILRQLPEEFKKRIDEDKIQYVLDVIYDYYDEKGFIEEDTAEEASIDEEEMAEFITRAARKDNVDLNEAEIAFILDAEFEYGKETGVYNEE